jgi:hypothetical protein
MDLRGGRELCGVRGLYSALWQRDNLPCAAGSDAEGDDPSDSHVDHGELSAMEATIIN